MFAKASAERMPLQGSHFSTWLPRRFFHTTLPKLVPDETIHLIHTYFDSMALRLMSPSPAQLRANPAHYGWECQKRPSL